MKLIIKHPKGKILSTYHLEKGDLIVKEKTMRAFAKKMNVEVKRAYSRFVDMTAYEFYGARKKIDKVAKFAIRWAK